MSIFSLASDIRYGESLRCPSFFARFARRQVFTQKGDAKDGMYKVTIGHETKMACGCTVGNTMGVNTWAAFAGTSEDALAVGDFVMLETELQTVLKTLRGKGINIVAIHQHMTGENPADDLPSLLRPRKSIGLSASG